jgi:general secretion pathway protein D
VFIEAEIVQIVLNKQFQRGVDWEKIFSQNSLKDLDIIGKFQVSPALSAYNKLTVGQLARDSYTTAINFLHTYGNTKVLSRPRIAAINNQEAKIMVGAREPYVSQTMSQADVSTVTAESVQFIDIGVKLFVVPTINKDGFVTMKIKPEVSSVRETIVTSLGSRIPVVETSEAETVVTVKDGTMVMIAGLLKEEKREDALGLPMLSKIPFVGALFGSRSNQNKNVELIIFITPHIISENVSLSPEEAQRFVPKDIMPTDMKNMLIIQELEKIRAKPLNTLPPLPRVTQVLSQNEINEKLKGIKNE